MLVSLMAWWLSPFMSMGLMPTFELVGKDYSYFILVFTQLRCRKDHVCINANAAVRGGPEESLPDLLARGPGILSLDS